MDLVAMLTTFGVVFLAELPDKTALTALVLSTRYPGRLVWLGVSLAFLVQVGVSVAAGGLLALLPERPVRLVAALLFALGAVLAFRGGDDDEEPGDERLPAATSAARVVATSFAVIFVAEWGDFTQFATAGLAARYGAPASVFLGAWLGLATVAALAVTLGRTLLRLVPLAAVRRLAGGLFALVAVATFASALRA